MTRRTRQVLLALTVTTALCADQVAAAAPSARPQVGGLAGQIVSRLTRTFRQSVTVEVPVHARQRWATESHVDPSPVDCTADFAPARLSPFQFRLPPPAL